MLLLELLLPVLSPLTPLGTLSLSGVSFGRAGEPQMTAGLGQFPSF